MYQFILGINDITTVRYEMGDISEQLNKITEYDRNKRVLDKFNLEIFTDNWTVTVNTKI